MYDFKFRHIYIHECDVNILNKLNDGKICFSLSRYEYDLSCPMVTGYGGSHDCFLFRSPIDSTIIDKIKHPQHLWNSEGVVLYELDKINLKLYNPCYQIKIVHLHKSNLREPNRITYDNTRRFLLPPVTL